MWHMGDGWGWWMASGWLWMIIVIGLVVWAASRIAGGASRFEPPARKEPSAREILDRRYAAGELSDEQYTAMRRRLDQPTGT